VTVLDELSAEVASDPDSLGLILHGSRASGVERPDSDFDLIRVVTDEAFAELKARDALREKRTAADGSSADVAYACPERFRWGAANPGWFTSMYVTAKVLVDEDGEVGQLVAALVEGGAASAAESLAETYDAYLNCFVRSLKAWRRGDELGGRMQAAESALYLVRLLFALERRWPPFHDQLGAPLRELEATQGWEEGYLSESLLRVLATGDPPFQQELERRVEALLESRGIAHEWGPEDDLEPLKAHPFGAHVAP
jgi:hypothetical protein